MNSEWIVAVLVAVVSFPLVTGLTYLFTHRKVKAETGVLVQDASSHAVSNLQAALERMDSDLKVALEQIEDLKAENRRMAQALFANWLEGSEQKWKEEH